MHFLKASWTLRFLILFRKLPNFYKSQTKLPQFVVRGAQALPVIGEGRLAKKLPAQHKSRGAAHNLLRACCWAAEVQLRQLGSWQQSCKRSMKLSANQFILQENECFSAESTASEMLQGLQNKNISFSLRSIPSLSDSILCQHYNSQLSAKFIRINSWFFFLNHLHTAFPSHQNHF